MSTATTPENQAFEASLEKELQDLRAQGLYRKLRIFGGAQEAECVIDGKKVINLSSNNYLGLNTHPRLKKAALEFVEREGAGTGSVRTIAGTNKEHMELERRLADFKHTEACLVFQSGFTANSGTVSAILGKDDLIISDALNHASIIDGCRLSKAPIKVFAHKDVEAAKQILEENKSHPGKKLLITDGVFSMDGDIGALPELCELARHYGCIMMVDDAHSSGVLGKNGRGSIDHFGLHGKVDIQVGTLSKALGALGGYVAGSQRLIDYLRHRARPILFSTSHPPAVVGACLAALDVLESEPELIERLWDNTRYFKAGLGKLGFDTGASETPITPVIAGETRLAMQLSDELFAEGVFAQGIGFPTVAKDKARVRAIVTAAHTHAQLDRALAAFEKVGRNLGLIS